MRFRAPVPADAPAVLAVLEARDRTDLGVIEYTLEDLRDEWRGLDLDLERDARVVELGDGRIVGYAVVRRPGTMAVVAPDQERRGIGARLLEWAERRDHERGREVHRQWVAADNVSARALLTGAGYHLARSYWRMVRRLDDVPAAPDPPPGVELGAVESARDAAALHAIDNAAFATAPDYVPVSVEEFVAEQFHAHDFDAGLSRKVMQGEQIVGFLLACRRDEGVGFVDVLAVAPAHQGRGLGTALLGSAFAGFAEAGLREALLGVDSGNAQGLRLYERAGMTVRYRFDIYERAAGPSRARQ